MAERKQFPKVNPGYGYGQGRGDLKSAEETYTKELGRDMTPYEKGDFRRGYWIGRAGWLWMFDIQGCIPYLKNADIEKLTSRLTELYRLTLVDIYGAEGARTFLEIDRK